MPTTILSGTRTYFQHNDFTNAIYRFFQDIDLIRVYSITITSKEFVGNYNRNTKCNDGDKLLITFTARPAGYNPPKETITFFNGVKKVFHPELYEFKLVNPERTFDYNTYTITIDHDKWYYDTYKCRIGFQRYTDISTISRDVNSLFTTLHTSEKIIERIKICRLGDERKRPKLQSIASSSKEGDEILHVFLSTCDETREKKHPAHTVSSSSLSSNDDDAKIIWAKIVDMPEVGLDPIYEVHKDINQPLLHIDLTVDGLIGKKTYEAFDIYIDAIPSFKLSTNNGEVKDRTECFAEKNYPRRW